MAADYLQRRLDAVRRRLVRLKVDVLLVTNAVNVRYASGFTGDDSWLVVGRERAALITDSRYTEQAAAECPLCDIVERKGTLHEACLRHLASSRARAAGFEESIPYAEWRRLADAGGVEWRPAAGIIEKLRLVKDAGEIAAIRRAIDIAEDAFRAVVPFVRPGVTEAGVANEIERLLRSLDAAGSSFETIVLFGERASLPHGRPGGRVLRPGEAVLIDWGARLGLYNSDLTRMLLPGTMSRKLERIYGAVLDAQQAALDAARPGMSSNELDAAARGRLGAARLAGRFGHGLGHGVGMEIHEGPAVSRLSRQRLAAGMVVTIEPGVYIPGWGGVRIEDMVLLTRTGRRVLTALPRNMEEVCVL